MVQREDGEHQIEIGIGEGKPFATSFSEAGNRAGSPEPARQFRERWLVPHGRRIDDPIVDGGVHIPRDKSGAAADVQHSAVELPEPGRVAREEIEKLALDRRRVGGREIRGTSPR